MPRGLPLTPEQLGIAAEVYARTGNFSEAARAVGAPDASTVRKALLRLGNPNRSQLHARAIDAGLQRGRRTLDGITREIRRRTRTAALRSALSFDDLLDAAKTTSYAVQRLVNLAELELARRQARLTRARTAAEIQRLQRDDALTTEQLLAALASLSREDLVKLLATLRERSAHAGSGPGA